MTLEEQNEALREALVKLSGAIDRLYEITQGEPHEAGEVAFVINAARAAAQKALACTY